MGGGTLYHTLEPVQARLNDASPQLIRCVCAIRDDAASVLRVLGTLVEGFPAYTDRPAQTVYYNNIRALFNGHYANDTVHAAAMIFLNRTCTPVASASSSPTATSPATGRPTRLPGSPWSASTRPARSTPTPPPVGPCPACSPGRAKRLTRTPDRFRLCQ